LLLDLVVLELLSALIGLPISLVASINQGWRFGQTVCYIEGMVMTSAG
jgi:hypothetical protein